MKRLILLAFLLPFTLSAQEKDFKTKHIEVWGQAERSILPNEIYTSITIKEYKDGSRRITLVDLEKQLVKAVAAVGIPKENLRVENIYGYNWDWKKKKSDEFLASKTFEIKTTDLKKMNDLLEKLDPEGVSVVNIKKMTHSDLKKIENELQLEALKNAKAKAQNLLSGIGENIGGVLEIQEMQQPTYYPQHRMEMMSSAKMAGDDYQSDVDTQMIKITSSIRAVFGIKE